MIDCKNDQRVLEIGCGAGNTLSFLKNNGYATYVEGIEIERACIELASRVLDKLVITDAETINFPDGTFYDVVLLLDVPEHLRDPFTLLKKVAKIISASGYIVISIPNIRNLGVLWQLIAHGNWEYKDSGIMDRTHLRFFTKKSFLLSLNSEVPSLKFVKWRANYDKHAAWLDWMKSVPVVTDFFVCQNIFRLAINNDHKGSINPRS